MTSVATVNKVRSEQLRLLFEALPTSLLATTLTSCILVSIFWTSPVPHNYLIIWLAIIMVTSIARLLLLFHYKKHFKSRIHNISRYEVSFIVGVFIAAILWSLVPILFVTTDVTYMMVIAFVIAGMCAGAVTSLSYRRVTINLFLFICLLPMTIEFILSDDFTLFATGIMTFMFMLLMLMSAERLYNNSIQNIILHLHSDQRESHLEKIIAERERLDDMKNDFISTVSHELRTPLTSIHGSLRLLDGGIAGEIPDKAHEMLTIACNNSERLLLLINDILDLQKIESGKFELQYSEIKLLPFLQQAMEENLGYAQTHDVSFNLVNCSDSHVIQGDPQRLMQVMNNLLSNAVKFSPRGSVVEVQCELTRNHVRISVTDHGEGIPSAFQNHLFDKFSQADSSTTKRVGGTGLGLSIAKLIVEKHNGKITFNSTEGLGTTFCVDLPLPSPSASLNKRP